MDGLIHQSELSWTKKNIHPGKILSTSQKIEVVLLEKDMEKRRLSLSYKNTTVNPWKKFAETNKKGDLLEGKIKNITDFGLFVELTEDLDGLIHLSDISWDDSGEEAIKKFKLNDLVKFKILEIDLEDDTISESAVVTLGYLVVFEIGKSTIVKLGGRTMVTMLNMNRKHKAEAEKDKRVTTSPVNKNHDDNREAKQKKKENKLGFGGKSSRFGEAFINDLERRKK